MRTLLRLADGIDSLNETVGRWAMWLALAVVLIGSWNAVARYLGRFMDLRLSSNAYLELQWYLFSLMFLLGAAYVLKHDGHVRVDVLIQKLTPKGQAWVRIAGTVLFLIPFCILVIWTSWFPVSASWSIHEMSPDPGGLARYPIKTAIPVGFLLLMLQGVASLIRSIHVVRTGEAAS